MTKRVGRNDLCPCGSGKKYKKCCELQTGSKRKLTASIISAGPSDQKGLEGRAAKISTNFFSKGQPLPEDMRKIEIDKPHHPPEADKPM